MIRANWLGGGGVVERVRETQILVVLFEKNQVRHGKSKLRVLHKIKTSLPLKHRFSLPW